MRIICLDDHPTMLDTLVRELNMISPGSAICAFQDAETALEYAAENGCDVLFCEIDLYGDDGLIFAEKMQAINPRLNIIFTTVCEEAERAKEVFRLHPSGYITKPYTRERLTAELNNLRYPVEQAYAPLHRSAPASSDLHRSAPAAELYRSPVAAYKAASRSERRPEFQSEFKSEYRPEPKPAPAFTRSPMYTPEPAPMYKPEPAPMYKPEPAPMYKPEPAPMPQAKPTAEPPGKDGAAEVKTRPMSSRDLRRLSRTELLEMLIAQTRETEKLKAQLREAEQKLEDKTLTVEKAGSIAQAAMQVNGVFEAAQRAADQYLENVCTHGQRFPLRELEMEYTDRAERLLADTQARCAMMERETARKCDEMTRMAQAETQARWSELHERMESYLHQHEQLRSLMGFYK